MGKQEVENCQALEKVPFLIDCVGGVCREAEDVPVYLFVHFSCFRSSA